MGVTITLPVCGLEVELAAWSWPKAKTYFQKTAEFLAEEGATSDDWLEKELRESYPEGVVAAALVSAPDALALYNDTVRYNKIGAEAVKNSSRSGSGQPTRTA